MPILLAGLLALAICLVGCSPTADNAEAPISEFRDLAAERLVAGIPDAKIRVVDADTLELTWPDGEKTLVDVADHFHAASREPARRDHLLNRLVEREKEVKAGALAPRAERLIAVVRSKTLLTELGAESRDLITKPIGGDLIQALAIDGDHSLRYATSEDLAKLKLSRPDAWRLAIENLPKRMGEVRINEIEGTGATGVSAESGLAASLILYPETCGPAFLQGRDDQVILLMDREFFATTTNRHPESVPAFWRLKAIIDRAGDGYSQTPITCRDGRWIVATPPKS